MDRWSRGARFPTTPLHCSQSTSRRNVQGFEIIHWNRNSQVLQHATDFKRARDAADGYVDAGSQRGDPILRLPAEFIEIELLLRIFVNNGSWRR